MAWSYSNGNLNFFIVVKNILEWQSTYSERETDRGLGHIVSILIQDQRQEEVDA